MMLEVEDLGVIIDSRLDFVSHLNQVITKAKIMLGFELAHSSNLNHSKFYTLHLSDTIWNIQRIFGFKISKNL